MIKRAIEYDLIPFYFFMKKMYIYLILCLDKLKDLYKFWTLYLFLNKKYLEFKINKVFIQIFQVW